MLLVPVNQGLVYYEGASGTANASACHAATFFSLRRGVSSQACMLKLLMSERDLMTNIPLLKMARSCYRRHPLLSTMHKKAVRTAQAL